MSTNPTPLSDTRFEAWYLRRIEDGTLGNSEGGSFGMDMIALAFRDGGDEARERVRVLEDAIASMDHARDCRGPWGTCNCARAALSPTEEPQ